MLPYYSTRAWRLLLLTALLLAVGCTSTVPDDADADAELTDEELDSSAWIAPDGDDSSPGTRAAPWATFEHALAQLEPGDTLLVDDGTYRERVTAVQLEPARQDAPIRVLAAPGANPTLQGLLWLTDPDNWHIHGLNVTWDPERNDHEEHMVKLIGGEGWQMTGAEISGARSFAAILVARAPANWRLADLCVHGTEESNDTNQDHLIYVNTGDGGGPGIIEGNVLFDAPNGMGVKLGGPSSDSEGTSQTTVRHNTIVDAAQPILVSWSSSQNVIEGNLLGEAGENYGAVRGYRLEGEGNVARDNAAFGVARFLMNDDGYRGVEDGGGNRFPVEPTFNSVDRCDGYVPTDEEFHAWGHVARE